MPTYTFRRFAATATGGVILGVSAHAVVVTTHQTGAHALFTYALALGAFVGAHILGRGDVRSHLAHVLVGSMLLIEVGNVIGSAETVIVRRETSGASIRTQQGAHEHAVAELVKADNKAEAAQQAKRTKSVETGCKDRCKAALDESVADAKRDLDRARAVYDANPKPTASASPMADRIGAPAWLLDLLLAALWAIGGTGCAAALIAYGSQSDFPNPDDLKPSDLDDARKVLREPSNSAPERPNRTKNRTISAAIQLPTPQPRRTVRRSKRSELMAYVVTETALGRSIPSQMSLAERFVMPKSTVADILKDMDKAGHIVRRVEGRRKVTAAN